MSFIRPGHERHQFNRINAKPEKMLNACGMRQCCNSAANILGNLRVKFGEGLHRHLINEAGRPVGQMLRKRLRC